MKSTLVIFGLVLLGCSQSSGSYDASGAGGGGVPSAEGRAEAGAARSTLRRSRTDSRWTRATESRTAVSR